MSSPDGQVDGRGRRLAAGHRRATGKTLAISGEIAVADAIAARSRSGTRRGRGLRRGPARSGRRHTRLQVKALVFDDTRRPHRLGQLKTDKTWDAVLLVLMDENYAAVEMLKPRAAIETALAEAKPNRRGTLSVARFRHLGTVVWTRETGTS